MATGLSYRLFCLTACGSAERCCGQTFVTLATCSVTSCDHCCRGHSRLHSEDDEGDCTQPVLALLAAK